MRVSPEEQQKFILALEMHASEISGDEWHLMASAMNWTVEQVKTFAFWYLNQLTSDGDRYRDRTNQPLEPADEQSSWTYEESVLFDNLLLRFPLENHENSELRWKKISSMIPNKDTVACKQRYEQTFRAKRK
jgi:hypothetical protein